MRRTAGHDHRGRVKSLPGKAYNSPAEVCKTEVSIAALESEYYVQYRFAWAYLAFVSIDACPSRNFSAFSSYSSRTPDVLHASFQSTVDW